MKQPERAESTPVARVRYAQPHLHDNGSVSELTAGTDSANDEQSCEKCIDGPFDLIARE
jgi:hypothetical protein